MKNWETYKKAYYATDIVTKELLSSTKIYDCGEVLLKKRGLSTNATDIIIPIGNNILNLSTFKETLVDLEELGITDAPLFITEIESCIKNSEAQSVLTSEIAEIETATKSLETVHTMQQDMKRAQQETPVYQSSQADLLQKTDEPVQPNANTPRWDTE
jgi:hypothetical protein